jgi:hypothetical protein
MNFKGKANATKTSAAIAENRPKLQLTNTLEFEAMLAKSD